MISCGTVPFESATLAATHLVVDGWALVAIASSITVGLALTLGKAVARGFVHGGLWDVIKSEWRAFLILALVQALGAILAIGALALVQPSRRTIVLISQGQPWAFWAVVGALAPFVAQSAIALLPSRREVSIDLRGSIGQINEQLNRLGSGVSDHLVSCLEQREDVWQSLRQEWVVKSFLAHVAGDRRRLMRSFKRRFEILVGNQRSLTLPDRWLGTWNDWDGLSDQEVSDSELPEAIAWTCIETGLLSQLASSVDMRLTDYKFTSELKAVASGGSSGAPPAGPRGGAIDALDDIPPVAE